PPLKAARVAEAPSSGGAYLWLDGSYQSIPLPGFDLGWKTATPTLPLRDLGSTDHHDPRVTGYGGSGAVGYAFPDGTFAPWLGSNVRIELGASHISAHSTQSTGATGTDYAMQAMSGAFIVNVQCGGGGICETRSTLASDYAAWKLNLKAASDYRLGTVTLTP